MFRCKTRLTHAGLLVGFITGWGLNGSAWAGERKFLVILAHAPKQFPSDGVPAGGFINPELIERQYFDTNANNVFSFAEYWNEISYGDITIKGRTAGWIDLPWAIQPPLTDPGRHVPDSRPPTGDNIENNALRNRPAAYLDLNNSGRYEYGWGELVINGLAQSIIDHDGDPRGVDNGPFFPGQGSSDTAQRGNPNSSGIPVWMPGERFVDIDEDERWDGLDERFNQMDFHTILTIMLPDGTSETEFIFGVPDGRPDLAGAFTDLNNNMAAEVSGRCSCAAGDTGCYMRDSDNDGNPDCCPNGPLELPMQGCPGNPRCDCPATTWAIQGGTITDCNGNLIDDTLDIEEGRSQDVLPFEASQVNMANVCCPGAGNGVPDECEYVFEPGANATFLLISFNAGCENAPPPQVCTPATPNRVKACREDNDAPPTDPCRMLQLPACVQPDPIPPVRQRCEAADGVEVGGDGDGEIDTVEPFENFLRRWDPCVYDPEASPQNLFRDQTHWVKVYDPQSEITGPNSARCFSPEYVVDYGDPSYIYNNYPGDPRRVIAQAERTPIFGQHDPGGVYPEDMCGCLMGIGFERLGDDEGELDCCGEADRPAAALLDGLGGRKCYPDGFDVDQDGRMATDEMGPVCVRVVEKPGGPCLDYDVNNNGTIQDDEKGLCLAGFHSQFDPPDRWLNETSAGPAGTTMVTSKMQSVPAPGGGALPTATDTPRPGSDPYFVFLGEEAWFDDSWTDRYGNCGILDSGAGINCCYDVTGQAAPCEPPCWPGETYNANPTPNNPQRCNPNNSFFSGNTPIMVPYVDPVEATYDPEFNRRYFHANSGGFNGDGSGWTGDDQMFLVFETGPLDEIGFEESLNRAILPEEVEGASTPGIFYDGWVEYDDLPSSKYHQAGDQWLGEITGPFRTYYGVEGVAIADLDVGQRHDPAFGETGTTDGLRIVPAIWGDDRGNHNPENPQIARDGMIMAAGPYARMVHGASGRDGGNNLITELQTWRTDGRSLNNGLLWQLQHGPHLLAGPSGENLGFRDYNLDGLVDQGEVRSPGSDNYIADPYVETANNGTNTEYPWNRRRLMEDCIEVLDDDGPDFDFYDDAAALDAVNCEIQQRGGGLTAANLPLQFWRSGQANFVIPTGIGSGIVLLPAGSAKVLAQGDDFPLAPGFYPIHNEDGLNNEGDETTRFPRTRSRNQISWNIFFHDLVTPLDRGGEGPREALSSNFLTDYSAHEYLHSWEGFPDLYDYDVFQQGGAQINCPIGRWDIMANGGLVHPTPVLKQSACQEWIEPVDIREVVTPGVDKVLTLPPAEFVRDSSYYYLENASRRGERFYLWSAGSGFDEAFPGNGMLVLHTDVGANPDALPRQQRVPPFTYFIVQADGQDELTSCTNLNNDPVGIADDRGDFGDMWPGRTGKQEFSCDTNPAARWYAGNECSGLRVFDITPDEAGSTRITVNWVPTTIPSFRFFDPPGGASVGTGNQNIYQVRGEAADEFGGTLIRFFYVPVDKAAQVANQTGEVYIQDLIKENGSNFIGSIFKNNSGSTNVSVDWNIATVGNERYVVVADLVPVIDPDQRPRPSLLDLQATEPAAGRSNQGNGSFVLHQVATNELVASGTFGNVLGNERTSFQAVNESSGHLINLRAMGVQVGDQLTLDGFAVRGPILRTITSVSDSTIDFQGAVTGQLINGPRPWQITRSRRLARAETWTVECVKKAPVQEWRVLSSITQAPTLTNADPYPHAITGTRYHSRNGAVSFTINAGSTSFEEGDRFSFTTTGITAPSGSVTVLDHEINEGPTAQIVANKFAGLPPLTVEFHGRESLEPNGEPLQYRWNFGDGTPLATGVQQTHTFTQPRTFSVILRVTNPRTGLFDETSVDIAVTNNSPKAVVRAEPNSGQAPLEVRLDGSGSTDQESGPGNLIYQWDFGDGTSANSEARRGTEFSRVNHTYSRNQAGAACTFQAPCTFDAKLTVTDQGGKEDSATVKIQVGNSRPRAVVTTSLLEGTEPFEVTFNGSMSNDPDMGDTITITWKFDDGTTAGPFPPSGPPGVTDGSVKHVYNRRAGEVSSVFNPSATVKDSKGAETIWTGPPVSVSGFIAGSSDPQAQFTILPDPPLLNKPFSADGRRSADRPGNLPVSSYSWDWGDGTAPGTGSTPSHTYTRPGRYTIRLTVADGDNPPHTGFAIKEVTVAGPDDPDMPDNRAPVAAFSASPPRANVGAEIVFDADESSDPDGDTLSYAWTFGDGGTARGQRVRHAYTRTGTFRVRLTVTDEHETSTELTDTVIISVDTDNREPVVFVAAGPRTGTAPLTLTFDARNSYDPDDDELTFSWEFMSAGVIVAEAEGPLARRTFETVGVFGARVVVTDALGAEVRSAEEIVTVFAPGSGGSGSDDGGDDEPEDRPIDGGGSSADQRPSGVCGLGMLFGLFGSLSGLGMLNLFYRRRY